ncbi:Copia protein [Cucumis melo var. makuwa]|uniref:Copia protein n=1 Tax=Cucumis melo var. makuwa TaxID=1194695 RepID=A0A5D3CZI4_CUCMM|nr:Copia protein [Cucumis melo var. makuwa]TYK17127.1 Copia protein [Cucumis melo var. makuwa]
MLERRPANTPIEFNCKLGNSDDQVPVDKEQYQRLVKVYLWLLYLCLGQSCNLEETWKSKKQSVVPKSSAEAKYRAMSLRIFAISIANNPIQHDRTKHFEINQHFIKERLDNGNICIPYIPSSR